MPLTFSILAASITPGMVFWIAVTVLIVVANILAKAKQNQSTQEEMRRQRMQRDKPQRPLEEIIAENIRRNQQSQNSPKRKAKRSGEPTRAAQASRGVQPPPPLPTRLAQALRPAPEPEAAPERARKQHVSESTRNVRLMLQPAGIREALILSEVLGKPKSLRDE